jgi:hypothetical protein
VSALLPAGLSLVVWAIAGPSPAGRAAWLAIHGVLLFAVRWMDGAPMGTPILGLGLFGLALAAPWSFAARQRNGSYGAGLIALGLAEIVVVAHGFTAWTGDAFLGNGPIGVVPAWAGLVGFVVRVVFEVAGLVHVLHGVRLVVGWGAPTPGPAPPLPALSGGPRAVADRVAPGFVGVLESVADGLPDGVPRYPAVIVLFLALVAVDWTWAVAATGLVVAAALHPRMGRVAPVGSALALVVAALLAGSPTARRAAWVFDGALGRFGMMLDASGLLAIAGGVMVLALAPRTPARGSMLVHPVSVGLLAGGTLVCLPWAQLPVVFRF